MVLSYEEIINNVYISPMDMIDNIDKIKSLANQNHPIGQAYLGVCYERGYGVEKDMPKAAKLYTKSANQNHPLGQACLGVCYEYGYGVEKDIVKAIELYTKSANQNHPLGRAYLGECYERGHGVEKDMMKAIELYTKSANQNHPIGQLYLGSCYKYGYGVEKDMMKAIELYTKSYGQQPHSFKRILNITNNCSYEQLLKIYEIAKYHNISRDRKCIEAELKKYKKSHNYIKIASYIMANDSMCSICYEEIDMIQVYLTKCLHYYHRICVKSQTKCPLCREDLEEINC